MQPFMSLHWETGPKVIKMIRSESKHSYDNEHVICHVLRFGQWQAYTGGSKLDCGSGSGMCVEVLDLETYSKLNNYNTIF